jgi:hypothetical protein
MLRSGEVEMCGGRVAQAPVICMPIAWEGSLQLEKNYRPKIVVLQRNGTVGP